MWGSPNGGVTATGGFELAMYDDLEPEFVEMMLNWYMFPATNIVSGTAYYKEK